MLLLLLPHHHSRIYIGHVHHMPRRLLLLGYLDLWMLHLWLFLLGGGYLHGGWGGGDLLGALGLLGGLALGLLVEGGDTGLCVSSFFGVYVAGEVLEALFECVSVVVGLEG